MILLLLPPPALLHQLDHLLLPLLMFMLCYRIPTSLLHCHFCELNHHHQHISWSVSCSSFSPSCSSVAVHDDRFKSPPPPLTTTSGLGALEESIPGREDINHINPFLYFQSNPIPTHPESYLQTGMVHWSWPAAGPCRRWA